MGLSLLRGQLAAAELAAVKAKVAKLTVTQQMMDMTAQQVGATSIRGGVVCWTTVAATRTTLLRCMMWWNSG